MRPEKLYLTDILEAAESVRKFCDGVTFDQFESDDMRRSAVLQKLIVIGEAAGRLAHEFTDKFPDIPWVDIIAFRNLAVHEYFVMKWDIVWLTATEDVPALHRQVEAILLKEYR
jgi:uncharacterized protein with HEPN domain